MLPLSAVCAGPASDEHFDAPPLFFARTEGSTPFRFSLHAGDVGHTLVIGPTGAGKSVLLALMALPFGAIGSRSLPSIRGRSAPRRRPWGDWHNSAGIIGPWVSPVAQPLASMTSAERGWLQGGSPPSSLGEDQRHARAKEHPGRP
jgi:type IV secretion system protein VirB4